MNDHNYYEDNRRFTLEIRDGKQTLLALADVEDFGGGVYKRLVVAGPRTLRCRIRRDYSLNVVLSGVFLDPFKPLRPVPETVLAAIPPAPAKTPATSPTDKPFAVHLRDYRRLQQLFRTSGPRVRPADIAEVAEIARESERLLRLARNDSRWAEAAAAGWMLCECEAFLGQTRAAERSFDRFLADFARALPPKDILPGFQKLTGEIAPASAHVRRPLAFRIGDYKPGRHRLCRLWRAAFEAAEKEAQRAGGNQSAVQAIARGAASIAAYHFPGETAEAKEFAAAFLEKHPAPPIRAPEAWLVAGRLWDLQDDSERAVQAFRRAIALAGAEARPVYWSELVQALDHARHPAAEVRAAFSQLLERTRAESKRNQEPCGTLHVASALVREKQYAAALRFLRKYAPGDRAAGPFIEECREHLTANRATSTGPPRPLATLEKKKAGPPGRTRPPQMKGGTEK